MGISLIRNFCFLLQVPIAEVTALLAFDTEAQATEFCERSGYLVSQNDGLTLLRSDARSADEGPWNFRRSQSLIECKFLNRTFGEVSYKCVQQYNIVQYKYIRTWLQYCYIAPKVFYYTLFISNAIDCERRAGGGAGSASAGDQFRRSGPLRGLEHSAGDGRAGE